MFSKVTLSRQIQAIYGSFIHEMYCQGPSVGVFLTQDMQLGIIDATLLFILF